MQAESCFKLGSFHFKNKTLIFPVIVEYIVFCWFYFDFDFLTSFLFHIIEGWQYLLLLAQIFMNLINFLGEGSTKEGNLNYHLKVIMPINSKGDFYDNRNRDFLKFHPELFTMNRVYRQSIRQVLKTIVASKWILGWEWYLKGCCY